MLRKAYVVGAFCVFIVFPWPGRGAELWPGLAALQDRGGAWSDISLCSYSAPNSFPEQPMLVSNVEASDSEGSGAEACDPCGQSLSGRLSGSGIGAGGLFGPLPPDSSTREGADSQVGRRVLFPGQTGSVDRAARGTTWLWVAPTYGSASLIGIEDSRFGVAEGIISGYRLTPHLGVYGSITFLHDEEMTTFLGTVGIQRFGNPAGAGLMDRASFWMFWDNCVDTLDGDETHFQQLRFNIGIVGPRGGEIGMAFSISLDEPRDYFLVPVGGTSFLSAGGSVVGPYVRYPIGIFDVTAMLGFSGQSDAGVLGLGARAWLTENVALFTEGKVGGADWGDNPSSLLAGLQLGYGRADLDRY